MIAVIDYDAGNAQSVVNALEHMGYRANLVSTPDQLQNTALIILPGVGSADATKHSLSKLGFWQELPQYILEEKKPFLGICVGLQILFEHSEEGDTDCLGWLSGTVKRFDPTQVRVPQMGWNKVIYRQDHPFYPNLKLHSETENKTNEKLVTSSPSINESDLYFYFVNSYYAVPTESKVIFGKAYYQTDFCAIANKENIFATQFHLEKSGEAGLSLFKNILTHFEISPILNQR